MPGEGGGGGEEQGDCHGQDGEQHLPQLGQYGQDGQGGRVIVIFMDVWAMLRVRNGNQADDQFGDQRAR